MSEWKKIKIGDFLKRKRIPIQLESDKEYKLITIKLYHKGVYLRGNKKGSEIHSNMYKVSKGDFILSGIDARNGAFGIVPDSLDGAIVTNDFWYFDIDELIIKKEFFLWLTSTPVFLDACQKASMGETQRIRLQKDAFFNYQIKCPSIEYQDEFLARINPIIEKIKIIQSETEKQTEYTKLLRQNILQEAIEGKLTADWRKQNPVQKGNPDYDAEALFEQIQKEKSQYKSEKLQEPLFFESLNIPQGWEYPTLFEITKQITDGTHITPNYVSDGEVFLSAQNVKPFKFIPEVHKFVSKKDFDIYRNNRTPEREDILMARVGAGIGEAAVIDTDLQFAFYVSLCLIKTFSNFCDVTYLCLVLNSAYGTKYAKNNISSNGSSAGNYNLGHIRSLKIPLPPLAEQKEIVKQVEKHLKTLSDLEVQITERELLTKKLMQSILKDAFEGK